MELIYIIIIIVLGITLISTGLVILYCIVEGRCEGFCDEFFGDCCYKPSYSDYEPDDDNSLVTPTYDPSTYKSTYIPSTYTPSTYVEPQKEQTEEITIITFVGYTRYQDSV